MSIVHDLHAGAAPAWSVPGELWLALLLGVSLAAGVLAGVVPPRRAAGPDRVPPSRPAWPLLGVLFGALGVYLFSASLYESFNHPLPAPRAVTQPQERPATETAFMSTVPPLLGFLAMLFGGHSSRVVSGQRLGLGARRMPQGAVWGLVGVVIVVPPLFVVAQAVELIYHHVHYRHPTEHPFLHTLGEKPGTAVVAAIVVGACVIAPLFEELLFRGYLQTVIRRMFHRLLTRNPSAIALPANAPVGQPLPALPPADAPPPTAAQTWLAILMTSLLFALVHPTWSQPVIFVLAVCLGYAYERTGNLWVPTTIHAGFNTLSTVAFLLGLYSHA